MPTDSAGHEPATHPEQLAAFFVERASAGDVEGLVALYEPDAVVAFPSAPPLQGHAAIREACAALVASRRDFPLGRELPTLFHGDLALTASLHEAGPRAQVARRQSDGSWLRILDRPQYGS